MQTPQGPNTDYTLRHYNEDGITDLLVGREIISAEDDRFQLDNGTTVVVEGNEGCGGCTDGHYHVDTVNLVEGRIMSVEFVDDFDRNAKWDSDQIYRVFILTNGIKSELYSVSGNDGNGYYGTGYTLNVRAAAQQNA